MPGPLVHLGKQGRRRNRLCPLTDDLSPDNHSRRGRGREAAAKARRSSPRWRDDLSPPPEKRTAGVQQLDIVQFAFWLGHRNILSTNISQVN